jgi:hypothetical protein
VLRVAVERLRHCRLQLGDVPRVLGLGEAEEPDVAAQDLDPAQTWE